ncbi:MAG: hypothetical protein M3Y21_01445 [Candidatus Eremiobacteraeota bacterium]|nr:hypothetical protein [Candidatus Eremiobacteraeota bacterium]
MRSLAAFFAERNPDIFAVCEIDAGDALALATRFERQWAYRGSQALFWSRRFSATRVYDEYLPFAAVRPFERRGLVRVEGELDGEACTLITTQLAAEREARIPELRTLRKMLRAVENAALLFLHSPIKGRGFSDLKFARADHPGLGKDAERVYVKDLPAEKIVFDTLEL